MNRLFLAENVYNLTPHAVHTYDSTGTVLLDTIPSDGELRLKSMLQVETGTLAAGKHTLPLASPQRFTGLDPVHKGYEVFAKERIRGDQVAFIVSAVVAEWLVAHPEELGGHACRILAPGTGPAFRVSDAAGKIMGTKRYEVYT